MAIGAEQYDIRPDTVLGVSVDVMKLQDAKLCRIAASFATPDFLKKNFLCNLTISHPGFLDFGQPEDIASSGAELPRIVCSPGLLEFQPAECTVNDGLWLRPRLGAFCRTMPTVQIRPDSAELLPTSSAVHNNTREMNSFGHGGLRCH